MEKKKKKKFQHVYIYLRQINKLKISYESLTNVLTTGNLSGILRINDNFLKFHNSSFPSFFTITKYCLQDNRFDST